MSLSRLFYPCRGRGLGGQEAAIVLCVRRGIYFTCDRYFGVVKLPRGCTLRFSEGDDSIRRGRALLYLF